MAKKKQTHTKNTNTQQNSQEKRQTPNGSSPSGFPVYRKLRDDLAAHGLKIREVKADGNCFFRAVADQLEVGGFWPCLVPARNMSELPMTYVLQGAIGDHMQLRQKAVSFMRQHQADFEPYMEDDEGFDKYCQRMAQACAPVAHPGLRCARENKGMERRARASSVPSPPRPVLGV